jgi:hypothetical protein
MSLFLNKLSVDYKVGPTFCVSYSTVGILLSKNINMPKPIQPEQAVT